MNSRVLKPKQGIILISEPSLQDFYFGKSIVLLAEHNQEGSFGVIVNKPIDVKLNEVIKGFDSFDWTVYLGGPVKTDSIFFLHTKPGIEQSMKIFEGLYWGGNIAKIRKLMLTGEIKPTEIRFYIGYAGWQPQQLDNEIKEKSWVLSHTTVEEVINNKPEDLWSSYLKNMGESYAIWANFPADPTLN